MVVGALLFWVWPSSKVSKADYEYLKGKAEQWEAYGHKQEQEQAKAQKAATYYLNQVQRYKAKNPKTTDFPAYKPAEGGK